MLPDDGGAHPVGPTAAALERARYRVSVADQLTLWIEKIEAGRAAVVERGASLSVQMRTSGEANESAVPAAVAGDQAEQMADAALHLTHWIERIETARAALRSNSLSLFPANRELAG
jgi:hypothetical protein